MELFHFSSEGNGFSIEPGPLLYVLILIYLVGLIISAKQSGLKLRAKSVKLKLPFDTGEVELELDEREERAAWCLYVEMSTRIVTQEMPDDVGSDEVALSSLYSLYTTSRELLKGIAPRSIARGKKSFGVLTLNMLNSELRGFLSKWHPQIVDGKFPTEHHAAFRAELRALQQQLAPIVNGLKSIFDND